MPWKDGDWSQYVASLNDLELSEKIIYIHNSILIFLGNTLVLVATWSEKSLHQPSKYFIACLAVADLLVSLFAIALNLIASEGNLSVHLRHFEN